jgi:4-diphosphocytidyl-2-C-methyl-D-erythritol kinase
LESITVKARAKINPYLDVLYKRADGYHELQTVMQTLQLHDTVFIKKIDKYPFRLICEPEGLPTDERNLVYRAARFIIDEFKIKQGIFVKLTKRIPISAGLGGGSADCAATLAGMNKLFNLGLTSKRLVEIAGTFGADVPFCILGGTVLATGVGEVLTPLPAHPPVWVLLAKPPVSVSTAAVFKAWKPDGAASADKADAITEGFKNKDLTTIAQNFYNALLPVTALMHPEIEALLTTIRDSGALGASMSGSGPTCFGYFKTLRDAETAYKAVSNAHPAIHEMHITCIGTVQ